MSVLYYVDKCRGSLGDCGITVVAKLSSPADLRQYSSRLAVQRKPPHLNMIMYSEAVGERSGSWRRLAQDKKPYSQCRTRSELNTINQRRLSSIIRITAL